MKKRLTAFAMAAALILSAATGVYAEKNYDELTVGTTTPITGEFFTTVWGNGAADLDVRQLIHGYDLVTWNSSEGEFETDPSVVSSLKVSMDGQGNKTLRIGIYQDLQYSDGTRITARDYLFTVLLTASPLMEELGGNAATPDYLLGYEAYRSGQTDVIEGLHLISDSEFSVTIDHASLPFFYELGLLDIIPSPIHVIAPGCRVSDNGNGAGITAEDGGDAAALFNAQVLEKTLLDEETGYCHHPSVTSGPYLLDSFDGQTAVFSINPLYKGDARGLRPSVEKITYTLAENETMADDVASGRFGLVSRVGNADTVDSLMKLQAQSGDISMSSYFRSGLSFISFCAQDSPVSSEAVRQALAWCLDRDAVTKAYEKSLGISVKGWYGGGQWMVSRMNGEMDSIPSYSAEDEAECLEKACALLEEDGWNLDEQGQPYQAGTGGVRCRQGENGMQPLSLELVYPEGNRIGDILEDTFVRPLSAAGIELKLRAEAPGRLLKYYYGQEPCDCDMIYLATNFDLVFDPARMFTGEDEAQPEWGNTGIADAALFALADDMRHTEFSDADGYCKKWLAFQERFAQTLPVLPVYSNVYFDFYEDILQGYEPTVGISWAAAVVDVSLSDPPASDEAVQETQTEEGTEEGTIIID